MLHVKIMVERGNSMSMGGVLTIMYRVNESFEQTREHRQGGNYCDFICKNSNANSPISSLINGDFGGYMKILSYLLHFAIKNNDFILIECAVQYMLQWSSDEDRELLLQSLSDEDRVVVLDNVAEQKRQR